MKISLLKKIFLLTLLLVPLVFNPFGYDMYEVSKNILFKSVTSIATIVVLIYALKTKKWKLHISKNSIYALLAFNLILILSLFTAERLEISFWGSYFRQGGFVNMIYYELLFLIITFFYRKKEDLIFFLKGLSIVSAIMSIYSISQKLGFDFFPTSLTDIFSYRSFSTMGNPTSFGAFLLFPIWGTIALFLTERKKHRPQNIFALTLLLIALILTKNRASILALIISGGLFFIHKFRKKKRILVSSLGIAAILFALFIQIYGADTRSLGSRLTIWDSSLEIIQEQPIWGSGFESFAYLFETHVKPDFFQYEDYQNLVDRPHNEFLEMYIHLGIFGAGFYLFLIAYAFFKFWRSEKPLPITMSLAILSLFVSNFFSFSLTTHYIFLAIFLGFLTITKNSFTFKRISILASFFIIIISCGLIWNTRLAFGDYYLAQAYSFLGTENTEKSLIYAEKVIKTIPFYVETYSETFPIFYGFTSATNNDKLVSITELINYREISMSLGGLKSQLHKAQLYLSQNNFTSAEETYKKLYTEGQRHPLLYEQWADLYFQQGRLAEAAIIYEQLFQLLPTGWEDDYIFWKNHPDFIETINKAVSSYGNSPL